MVKLSPMSHYQKYAALGIRLIALFWASLGLWMLLSNVIESAGDFNPSYWVFYLKTQVLRPALAIILGGLLCLLSTRMSKVTARGLDG